MYDLEKPCGVGYCNVVTYPRLHDQSREGSAAWSEAKPPEVPKAEYKVSAIVVVVGAVICITGGLGLVVVVIGLALGARVWQGVVQAEAARALWERKRYCVACDKRIAPEGGAYEAA